MSNIFIEPMGLSGASGLQPHAMSPQTPDSSKLMADGVTPEISPEGELLPESFSLALASPAIVAKAGRNDLSPNQTLINDATVEALAEQSAQGLLRPSDVVIVSGHRGESSANPRAILPGGITENTTLAIDGAIDMSEPTITEPAANTIITGSVELDTPNAEAAAPTLMSSPNLLSSRPPVLSGNNTEAVVPVEREGVSVVEGGNTNTPFSPLPAAPRGLTAQTKIAEVEPAMQGAVTSVLAAAFNSKSATVLGSTTAEQDGELVSGSNGSILAKMAGSNALMQPLVKNMAHESFGRELVSTNITEPADEAVDVKPSATPTATAAHEKLSASTQGAEAKVVVQANVRVGMPGWADQIAERTANLVSQNIKQAEIQLNPQEMGSINVKISVTQEQAAVTFTVANGVVREALDQTLQRLRENFESEGMDLVQADVRDDGQTQGEEGAERGSFSDDADILEDAEGDEVMVVAVEPSGVDHFV